MIRRHTRAILLIAVAGCGVPASSTAPSTWTEPAPITAGASPDTTLLDCIGGEEAWAQRDEIEPHVAVSPADPTHLVAAWMLRAPGGPGALQAAVSRDGGQSWSEPRTLPVGNCGGGGEGALYASDPWVAIDGDGRAYLSAIEWAPGNDGDGVNTFVALTSPDGGLSWEAPVVLSDLGESGAQFDNTAVASSPDETGVAYVTGTRYQGETGPAAVYRTRDGGGSWQFVGAPPVASAAAPYALAPQPLIGPRPGELWIAFGHDPRGARVAVARSTDGGESWSDPVSVASWERPREWPTYPGTDHELHVAPDIVSAGVDRAGSILWIAHQASRTDGTPTISVAWSTDQGSTWRDSTVLSPDEVGWRPTLGVEPGGPVALTWYRPDAGGAPASAHPTAVELAVLRVGDDGTLEILRRSTLDRFDWAPRRNGTWFLGDYHGMVVSGNAAVPVYSRSTPDGIRVFAARRPLEDPGDGR